jgi:ABC-type multidrug transport system permease subunit
MNYKFDRGTRNAAIIFLLVVAFLIVAAIVGAYV